MKLLTKFIFQYIECYHPLTPPQKDIKIFSSIICSHNGILDWHWILSYSPWWVCLEGFCIDIPNRWHTTWQRRWNGIVIIHNCITFLVLHWFHRHHVEAVFLYFFISHKNFLSLLFICFLFYLSDSHENVGDDDDMIVGKILCMSNLMAKKISQI